MKMTYRPELRGLLQTTRTAPLAPRLCAVLHCRLRIADPSTDNGAKEVAAMAGKISGNNHIELSLRTRRNLEDQAVRSRRRQAQSVSARSRRKRITLPRVSLLDTET